MRSEEYDDLMGRLEERDATIERLLGEIHELQTSNEMLRDMLEAKRKENEDLWRRL